MAIKSVLTFDHVNAEASADVQMTFSLPGSGGADITVAEELAINTAFSDFLNVASGTMTEAIGKYLSPVLSRATGSVRLDLYDINDHLDGSPHGSPFSSSLLNLTTPAVATALPSEVCVAVTLEAVGRSAAAVSAPDGSDAGSALDRPQTRRTGRFFFGPLTGSASTLDAGIARPNSSMLTNLRLAVLKLDLDLAAAAVGVMGLGVWSRKDADIRLLEAVSTDNSFDTQRRRGEDPTARTRSTVV